MVTPPAIRVDGLCCRYGARRAVTGLSGVFAPGSLTAVVGPNGGGKTTLLRSLAGLHPGHGGRIEMGGLAPRDIALLPQASALDRSFPVTAGEVVALGGWGAMGAFGAAPVGLADRVDAALGQVGLAGFAGRSIGELVTDAPGMELAVVEGECRPKFIKYEVVKKADRGGRGVYDLKVTVPPGRQFGAILDNPIIVIESKGLNPQRIRIPVKGSGDPG